MRIQPLASHALSIGNLGWGHSNGYGVSKHICFLETICNGYREPHECSHVVPFNNFASKVYAAKHVLGRRISLFSSFVKPIHRFN